MKHEYIKLQVLLAFLSIFFTSTVLAKTNIESYLTEVVVQDFVSGINGVDCVYVINLEHRHQKWIEVRNAFNAFGIHPNRVNAINGWMLSKEGSVDYELPIGGADTRIKFHLDANYSQATQSFDQFATKNDESFVVNGRVSVLDIGLGAGDQKLTFGFWARNLLNTQYVYRRDPSNSLPSVQSNAVAGVPNITVIANNGGILGDYGNFNMPRTFGVDASIKF